jgi:peptide chain release factor 2
MSVEGFWNDRSRAEKLGRESKYKTSLLETAGELTGRLSELKELSELYSVDDVSERSDLQTELELLDGRISAFRAKLFLNKKYDDANVILNIHAGTGGKDAQDFAQMLLRMYIRFFERNGYTAKILDMSEAEDVGIKSVTVEVKGDMAYGYLKGEHGVHRLVRLSPFNAKNTRETSFAMVEILPMVEDDDVQIDPKDIRVDTYRASGKGGQGVNTTDSAVRITHMPTGVVVQCQNERSQIQNREAAMKVLVARLVELQQEQKVQTINDIKGTRKQISWGNQIRSYVLQPYTMVKDHRTDCETGSVDKVFDGEIDRFIQAYLLREQ